MVVVCLYLITMVKREEIVGNLFKFRARGRLKRRNITIGLRLLKSTKLAACDKVTFDYGRMNSDAAFLYTKDCYVAVPNPRPHDCRCSHDVVCGASFCRQAG
ncbi:hypothetical protein NEISICOT_00128 [Neisseria sicca ATCC 29256]|uniref:Uncharacterized protein n=1 Tax=Neisseria sicca ATCC 29256 TaxID=547045 RepID=C6M0V2_NEISI|nr:hypothetical protein NEISICOT_00128 [Neisseria sicca ATCC 29256]